VEPPSAGHAARTRSGLAQLVEQLTVNQRVVGSSPTSGELKKDHPTMGWSFHQSGDLYSVGRPVLKCKIWHPVDSTITNPTRFTTAGGELVHDNALGAILDGRRLAQKDYTELLGWKTATRLERRDPADAEPFLR
jgi:hypothetical protein